MASYKVPINFVIAMLIVAVTPGRENVVVGAFKEPDLGAGIAAVPRLV